MCAKTILRVAALAAALLPLPATAMQMAAVSSGASPGDVVIVMAGHVEEGDAARFQQIMSSLGRRPSGGQVGIQIDSLGGLLNEAEPIAKIVHEMNIPVTIMPDGSCASACFVILAAAQKRYSFFASGVSIGVHSATSVNRGDDDGAKARTIKMARLCGEYGIPAPIIGRMVLTPQTEIVWLSATDLQSMGVRLINPSALTAGQQASLQDLQKVSNDLAQGRLRASPGQVLAIR